MPSGPVTELSEKIKELVRLAQEQGQLTFNDISEALPESEATPEKLDEIYSKLRALEIEIVDQAEMDNVKEIPKPTRKTRRGWTFWTTRCGCISSKWGRWPC